MSDARMRPGRYWSVEQQRWIYWEEAQHMARMFHEAYERLAPEFGYATREDTRTFDPESPNGLLMTAVCAELLNTYTPKEAQ